MYIMSKFSSIDDLCEKNQMLSEMMQGKSVLRINGIQTAMMNVSKIFFTKCGNEICLIVIQKSNIPLEIIFTDGQAVIVQEAERSNDSYLNIVIKENVCIC